LACFAQQISVTFEKNQNGKFDAELIKLALLRKAVK
jgi:hypothetical protein